MLKSCTGAQTWLKRDTSSFSCPSTPQTWPRHGLCVGRVFGKLKKGSLQIKKRNLEAKQSRVPRICVEEHAYACCSYPQPTP
ncbi:hypothetical protein PIB30_091847, partial [Stylosanthes scabra]|nr:hypothetical protein [Stylosanthes scabra]